MGTMAHSRRHDRLPGMEQVVAHGLASDASAALVVSRDPGPQPVLSWTEATLQSRLWSDALDQNDLTVSDDHQPLLAVGKAIRERIVDEAAALLTPSHLASPLILHPGGLALMKRLAEAYPGLRESTERSTSVLADHGNVGSASVWFVLDRAARQGARLGPELGLFALGPGIFSSLLTLQGVR